MSIVQYSTKLKRKTLNLLGAVSVLALMLPATNSPALAQSGSAEPNGGMEAPIDGTWIVTVDRINTGVKFTAMQSFTAGGVALATGAIDRQPPPPISPIYGSWKRKARNNFDVTIYFFVFDLTGNAVAMIKNNENFRLSDANHLVGSGIGFACDLQGENCVNLGSTIQITGKRVVPESIAE